MKFADSRFNLIRVGSSFGEPNSPLAATIKQKFHHILRSQGLDYTDLNDSTFNQLLEQATIESYRSIRVPGKYMYDPSQGEPTIEDFEADLRVELSKRFDNFYSRGLQFPPQQQ